MMVLMLFILVLYVTMVYGPIAAMLVEMFPTRIRYTSMSLPYHIGNGWFGGLLPTISFALVAFKGDIYYGLWYPIIIALITVVIGALFVRRETKNNATSTRPTDIVKFAKRILDNGKRLGSMIEELLEALSFQRGQKLPLAC
jgi:glucan phosphoethanolaminetransferase (alkaline phosphatase superfamily)